MNGSNDWRWLSFYFNLLPHEILTKLNWQTTDREWRIRMDDDADIRPIDQPNKWLQFISFRLLNMEFCVSTMTNFTVDISSCFFFFGRGSEISEKSLCANWLMKNCCTWVGGNDFQHFFSTSYRMNDNFENRNKI